jgi:hypothetical protein
MGESICVTKRLVDVDSGLAKFEPTAIYLYPLDGDRWASTRGGIGIADVQFDELEDAIEFAVACLEIADWRSDGTNT